MAENTRDLKTTRSDVQPCRIGLFGGTFNPVHLGHVEIACNVKEGFDLDTILVIPSAIPPHKSVVGIASAQDRLEMTRLCFDELTGFRVSDIELKREGKSFTIDTVKHLLSDFSKGSELFLMIGTDAFFEIHTWREFNELLDAVKIIVMTRPGDHMESDENKKIIAGQYLDEKISKDYVWSPDKNCFNHKIKKTIFFYNVTPLDISSTKVRKYIAENNCSANAFINTNVADYISKKGLYQ